MCNRSQALHTAFPQPPNWCCTTSLPGIADQRANQHRLQQHERLTPKLARSMLHASDRCPLQQCPCSLRPGTLLGSCKHSAAAWMAGNTYTKHWQQEHARVLCFALRGICRHNAVAIELHLLGGAPGLVTSIRLTDVTTLDLAAAHLAAAQQGWRWTAICSPHATPDHKRLPCSQSTHIMQALHGTSQAERRVRRVLEVRGVSQM